MRTGDAGSARLSEPIIEPELPIIDPHHHMWFRPSAFLAALAREKNLMAQSLLPALKQHARYLLEELLADLGAGHNIRATVFVEAHAMHRVSGPEHLRSVGEVEFANGTAAMAASGVFGDVAVCAGIVGSVDLRLGDAAKDVLLTHMQISHARYRGIRAQAVVYDADPTLLGAFGGVPQLLSDSSFRAGFKHLAPLGLSYDAWQLEYQLPELLDLAHAFPDTQIIVNHVGGLFGIGKYKGLTKARFLRWRDNMRALSGCENVAVKLGGLGMPTCGLPSGATPNSASSEQLANEWRPYIEPCIEAFGVTRCMFESNYPVDAATATYPVIWNAFKRLASGASSSEKAALFHDTAKRIYKLEY